MSDLLKSPLLKIGLSLLALGIVFPVTGIFAGYVTQAEASVLTAGFQSLASVLLILVTMRYTESTKENVRLTNERIKLELRQDHTEVLRDRIETWLGTKESEMNFGTDISGQSNRSLPEVRNVTVKSASESSLYSAEEFRAAPKELEKDRYFQDLLDNHAIDLKELKERIEKKYGQFLKAKDEFGDAEFETGLKDIPSDEDTQGDVSEWAFRSIILLERTDKSKKDLQEDIFDHFGGYDISPSEDSYDGVTMVGENIFDPDSTELRDLYVDALDELDEHPKYGVGSEAAELLDEIEADCKELERKLIEYKGRLVYSGSCEYLKEANVTQ